MKNLNLKQTSGSRSRIVNREESNPRKAKVLDEKLIKMIYEGCFSTDLKSNTITVNQKNMFDVFNFLKDPKSKHLLIMFRHAKAKCT